MAEKRPKILVAPLDWGLGHATRCIPIINELIVNNCEVILAADGAQKKLLQDEFPSLRVVELQGYRIQYGRNGRQTIRKIILQIPKILMQINRERGWLNRFQAREELDGVISDNRYGLHHPNIRSVLVCHQLYIPSSFGRIVDAILMNIHYRYIRKFTICWVPDFVRNYSLAGLLSHPTPLPFVDLRYTGCLTRFKKLPEPVVPGSVLVILSGPEPQRGILEQIIWKDLPAYKGKLTLVRGLPAATETPEYPPGVEVYNHLPAAELNRLVCAAEIVISRSGYSSVMDLLMLGKKTIMIPTEGQPEQEYLAEYLSGKNWAYVIQQKDFGLLSALNAAGEFVFTKYEPPQGDGLSAAVRAFLSGPRGQ
ncbi:MAG TPA: glycosyltransferase [Puia sp.]|nr:glycosyltransferase [Puia sp.]